MPIGWSGASGKLGAAVAAELSAHLHVADYPGVVPAIVGLVAQLTSFLTQKAARAKQSPYPRLPD